MHAMKFDTLEFAENLQTSGFDEQQAKGIVKALSDAQEVHFEELASKRDLHELKHELKQDMAEMRVELMQGMAEMRVELVKWVIGAAAAVIGILFTLLRFMP